MRYKRTGEVQERPEEGQDDRGRTVEPEEGQEAGEGQKRPGEG
jgi:hypothetical protein